MFQLMINRDGPVSAYSLPLVVDDENDAGHEFFVEDLSTGEMRKDGPSAFDADCWYRVVHKPSIMLRVKPDLKAPAIGKRSVGERLRVQKIVDNKWLLLHDSELKKLNVKEAWALSDGADMKMGKLL